MTRAVVYEFTKYDVASDKTVRAPRPATIEAITRAGGQAIESTMREVDAAELDGNGFLRTP